LRGERTGIRYAIGTRVRVQVSRVDLDGRKIDFRLVREGEDLTSRAMKDKGGAPVKASAKRSSRHKVEAGGESRSEHGGGGAAAVPAGPQSAMQAFKSAVKKAANKMQGKGRKPRRG